MALTDVAVKAAKPKDKPYKLFDERGLFLLVTPNGGRWWRFKYRIDGREKLLSLGTYPDVLLAKARQKRDDARRLLTDEIDPSTARQADRAGRENSFEAIAREFLATQRKKLDPGTYGKKLAWFERHIFPSIGRPPIRKVSAQDILSMLRKVESRGRHETAHRLRAACGAVFRYAIATGRADRDPAADLRGALAPVVVTNHAAITDPKRIGELLRAIGTYSGQPATVAALKLAPLVFVRPGELRGAEWTEFQLTGENPQWRIPAARMKAGREHIVPLATQAVAVLRDMQSISGSGRYVFPSLRGQHRSMSSNTVNVALRLLGYPKDEMTGHGFRAMASTMLHEQGYDSDVIELQLAHAERDQVKAAYRRERWASRMPERRKMMQSWADFLDGLRSGADVVPFKRKA
jgi:integrase